MYQVKTKTGKFYDMEEREGVIRSVGCVNNKILKSVFLRHQFWVQPRHEIEEPERLIRMIRRETKLVVLESLNKKVFKEHFIVDLDLRAFGMRLGKPSFLSIETTLFPKNEKMPLKFWVVDIEELSRTIIRESSCLNQHFTVSARKPKE